ncbi:uncharacterized protein BO95DRAFT_85229 [Aspergillus brunneoviolaceus CBS 621.78]|uniref:Uncharacterized protein n=1 Tax=Aspergillus brunneoviolaceus CBS 621.78 TaxID=1450534 RepID=A0ACD1GCY1_9EURO|nr:hypothetical protein BO95DRAFT_85229 [Aspergillus brunneoviolaceus CBS 621.78]RAH47160.1 hypothetical protein BO95DRAFT_85229 [Aspergillus brunneoviolaceus CBS 621.78]
MRRPFFPASRTRLMIMNDFWRMYNLSSIYCEFVGASLAILHLIKVTKVTHGTAFAGGSQREIYVLIKEPFNHR